MRAAIYVRISDDREGRGLGIERQRLDCLELAQRLGWDAGEVYADNDVSAYSGAARPSYRRLLADVEAGTVDAILAWHTDRLHRSPIELEGFIDLLDRRSVAVQTVQAGPLDLATASGRMVARMLGAAARYESEHKGDRSRRKALELAEAGHPGGGRRPYGYEADRVTPHPVEAPALIDAYARTLAGGSLSSTARALDAVGLRPGGARWSVPELRRTLLRPRYAGLRAHRGQIVGPGRWPGLVTVEAWEQARAILTDPQRRSPTSPGFARTSLLAGLLRCSEDGHRLDAMARDRAGCRRGDPGRGAHLSVPASAVEALVVEAALDRVETAGVEPQARGEDVDGLLDRVRADEARLTALADAYADGGGDALELRRAGSAIRARIDATRRVIAAVRRRDGADRGALGVREWWATCDDLEQRRAWLLEIVDRVDVAPAPVRGGRFDVDRLTIVWR